MKLEERYDGRLLLVKGKIGMRVDMISIHLMHVGIFARMN